MSKNLKSKKVKFRIFTDLEQELEWLNCMSAQGLHLAARYLYFYQFIEDSTVSYQYQVDVKSVKKDAGSHRQYEDFLADMGIEIACWHVNYCYLSREASSEPFEFFTEPEEWIKQYKRQALFNGLSLVFFLILLLSNSNHSAKGPYLLKIDGFFAISFTGIFYSMIIIASALGLKKSLKRLGESYVR